VGNHALSTVEAKGVELPPEAKAGGTVSHPPGASTFHASADRATVETLGPDRTPVTVPLSYVVGRRRIRMYVKALPTGPNQVLPAMREEGTGAWFDYTHLIFGAPGLPPDVAPTVAPGDPSFWTGPVRSFDARCARCHVSGREAVAPAADGTGPRSTWRALGVDCEACHGPCGDHVALWRSPPRGAVQDPVQKLRDLDHGASLAVCFVCHLEGEVVDAAFDGKDLFEHVDPTLLDDAERVDPCGPPARAGLRGRFLVSRCVEQGKLTCASCHASHGSPHGPSRARDRRRLCSRCHTRIAAEAGKHAHHKGGQRAALCRVPHAEGSPSSGAMGP
jgi:predicted CXXCH cytochrome family protein